MAYNPMSQYKHVKCKWIRAEMQKNFRSPTRTKYDLQTTRAAYIGWLLRRDGFEPMKYQISRVGRWDLPGFSLAQPQLAIIPGGVQNYIRVTTSEGYEASALLPIHIFQDPSLYETCEESHEPEAEAVEAPLFADHAPAVEPAEESQAEPEADAAEWVNMAPFGFPEFEAFPAATLPSGACLMRIRPVDCPLASVCWEAPGAAMASLNALLEMAGRLRAAYAETAAALPSGGMRQAPARAAMPDQLASDARPQRGDQRAPLWRDEIRQPVPGRMSGAGSSLWRDERWRLPRLSGGMSAGLGPIWQDEARRARRGGMNAGVQPLWRDEASRSLPPSGGMRQGQDPPWRNERRRPLWRNEARGPPVYSSWRDEFRWNRSHSWRDEGRSRRRSSIRTSSHLDLRAVRRSSRDMDSEPGMYTP